MYKLMICGGRDFANKELCFSSIQKFLEEENLDYSHLIILEGECPTGTDSFAKEFALSHNILLEKYPADWNKYGKAAGPIRNKQMVKECDCCLAFWDYKSKGTKSSIDFCKELEKKVKIIPYI